jgi:hypothetical protein
MDHFALVERKNDPQNEHKVLLSDKDEARFDAIDRAFNC